MSSFRRDPTLDTELDHHRLQVIPNPIMRMSQLRFGKPIVIYICVYATLFDIMKKKNMVIFFFERSNVPQTMSMMPNCNCDILITEFK
jgi:hypothetical protein